MKELTPEEVLAQISVTSKADEHESAAALAVLAAAISESQNLGRMVVSQGESNWNTPQLRADLSTNTSKGLRAPIH